MKFIAAAPLALALLALPGRAGRPHRPQTDPASCPPEGDGGDAALNRRKNRTAPPASPRPMALADFAQLPGQPFAQKLRRARWPAWWRGRVDGLEDRGVIVEGFVAEARIMGRETANCRDRTLADVHLALAESPGAPRERWLVAELTPRLRGAHPMWHMKRLRRLSRDTARVRLTGWLLYDHEHLDRVGANRISPWEIHPVTRIEVWNGGSWEEF